MTLNSGYHSTRFNHGHDRCYFGSPWSNSSQISEMDAIKCIGETRCNPNNFPRAPLRGWSTGSYLSGGHQFISLRINSDDLPSNVDGRFGLAIISITCIQAGFGWHHHRMYIRNKPKRRRWYTQVHLWLGRFVIVFGVVNCGLGLLIAQVPMKWAITWWTCCSFFIIMYSGAYVYRLRLSVDSIDDDREP